MNDELYDKPGIIITPDKVIKTTKIKKWILKNNPDTYTVKYLENPSSDFKEMERQLQVMLNEANGVTTPIKEKEIREPQIEYRYQYRANINTVYLSHTKSGLQRLLNNHGINVNVDDLYEN